MPDITNDLAAHVAEGLSERILTKLDETPLAEKGWRLIAPAGGLCGLCRGSGQLLCYQDGEREFWECPACGGVGCRSLFGKPTVPIRNGARVRALVAKEAGRE